MSSRRRFIFGKPYVEEKRKGDHGQKDMMMESGPRAPLEVVKAELLLVDGRRETRFSVRAGLVG